MAKSSSTSKGQAQFEQLLRFGGAKIPAGLAAKSHAAVKAVLKKKWDAQNELRQQSAKLYDALQGASTIDVKNPANKSALDGLLALNKKFAAKKLPFPKVRPALGDVLPNPFSGTVFPPFDYYDTIGGGPNNVGNPATVYTAYPNGQINASVATSFAPGFNMGETYAVVGFSFQHTAPGTLTISSSPTYNFWWSTNALDLYYGVGSYVSISLNIYGIQGKQVLANSGTNYYEYDVMNMTGVHFKFGEDIQQSASVSLPVTPELIYHCFVAVNANAYGGGWPHSVATAMASATVPSISYQFTPLIRG